MKIAHTVRQGLLLASVLVFATGIVACGGVMPPQATPTATPVKRDEVPQELSTWASQQRTAKKSGSKMVTVDGTTYLAISGGLQRSGGFRVEVTGLVKTGKGWAIHYRVVPPGPDVMVTMALENPTAFYKVPKLDGEIELVLQK